MNTLNEIFRPILTLALWTFLTALYGQNSHFVRGADGSLVDQVEQSGGVFYENGVEKDAYEIFRDHGINNIRLKLWHSPEEPYNGLTRVLMMAKRVKALGMELTLDFHFSDTWADPGHQTKPAAWSDLPYDLLTDSIRQYTRYVIYRMKQQNTLPKYVQIGNEINCGILWNDGRVCNPYDNSTQWNKLGGLLKNAIQGIHEATTDEDTLKIILHFGDGGDNGACRWFYDNISEQSVPYDIIGLSYYPWWHGIFAGLQYNLNDLAQRYGKEIMIVETGYPWTLGWNDNTNNIVGQPGQLMEGYPATIDGQYRYIRDLILLIKNTEGDKGAGMIYWSPEWISAPGLGSPWENVSLFDFENEMLSSIVAFDENTGITSGQASEFGLENFPNPFQQSTSIRFQMNEPGSVEITIYDAMGNKVFTPDRHAFPAGLQSVSWNSHQLPEGIYFVEIIIRDKKYRRKLVKSGH
ncbi:MAG: glycosyl hydrolase 53 family protein [bacterium]